MNEHWRSICSNLRRNHKHKIRNYLISTFCTSGLQKSNEIKLFNILTFLSIFCRSPPHYHLFDWQLVSVAFSQMKFVNFCVLLWVIIISFASKVWTYYNVLDKSLYLHYIPVVIMIREVIPTNVLNLSNFKSEQTRSIFMCHFKFAN